MTTATVALHLHAGSHLNPAACLSQHSAQVIASVTGSSRESWTILTTETDALRELAAALLKAAEKADALWAENYSPAISVPCTAHPDRESVGGQAGGDEPNVLFCQECMDDSYAQDIA